MLPIILALAGGYLIVDSQKDKLKFENGGQIESISDLSEELQNWCDDNNFPQMSADELLVEESIKTTPSQKEYLRKFIERWDDTVDKMADGGKMAKGGTIKEEDYFLVLKGMKIKRFRVFSIDGDDVKINYSLDVSPFSSVTTQMSLNDMKWMLKNGYIKKTNEKEYWKDEYKNTSQSTFADGGKMAKGGMSDRYSTEVGDEVITVIKNRKEVSGFPVYARVSGNAPITVGVFPTKEKAMAKAKQLEKNNKYADGGGVGVNDKYVVWVSKDGSKRELFGEFKSKRAADMQMKKLWEKGEYKGMGNLPKATYEKRGL